MNVKIKRALISAFDKNGIETIAQVLADYGCEIISTGGTFRQLKEAGIPVTEISNLTKTPEAFGGRMKTISFHIESAILFDREKDALEAQSLSIEPIDMVICNFYPFKKILENNVNHETLIENIDIGGPTMVRAAAKNHKFVTVATSPEDYCGLIEELKANNGSIGAPTRERLMRAAFHYTADYDAMIATAMDKEVGHNSIRLSFHKGKPLRYGENPHQKAMFYRERQGEASLYDFEVLNGKELSFNNLLDVNTAIDAVEDFLRPACCVIKHSIPCGLCESENPLQALEYAWASDPISAFGSVIAINQEVSVSIASFFNLQDENKTKRKFVEVVIAQSFTSEALNILKSHKNLRLLKYDWSQKKDAFEIRFFKGAMLLQERNQALYQEIDCVTKRAPATCNEGLIQFGLKSIKHIRSNAIAIVRELQNGSYQLLGMGAGQPNRLVSVQLAFDKAKENLLREYTGPESRQIAYVQEVLAQSILVSEAFFPFPDSIELCAQKGIKTIIQPGGSINDEAVVESCNKHGIAMYLTGIRHFKH